MPGISPLDQGDWLRVDETYAAQLAEKARIVEKDRDLVLAMSEDARLAAEEL
ncbi:MAG: heme-dependent oxidative N-demethylase subunit alpha family protein, partial [Lentibacter algarum]